MEMEHMLAIPGVDGARLVRCTVAGVEVEGRVVVITEGRSDAFRCEVLQTGDSGFVLVAGDAVLVWHPERSDECGVVLGRIGPSNAPPEPTEEGPPAELVIEATKNLTLRVGGGCITIREDGKILIKGKDLVSHAQRLNRIKGGAVQIN
jgi:hypothetical protein